MSRVQRSLEEVFGLTFNQSQFWRSKRYVMALYQPLCDEILQSILKCPQCRSKDILKAKQMSRELVDLKFSNGGVKKWITRTVWRSYACAKCKHRFSSQERPHNPHTFGRMNTFSRW